MTADAPWEPVDRLGEALHLLRMRGAFYCRTEVTAPWALEMPMFEDCLSFHVVTEGTCWVEVGSEPPLRLGAGDLALVPHGRGHLLASEPGLAPAGRVDRLPQEHLGEHYAVLRYGGGGTASQLVCGIMSFDDPAAFQLLRLLPPVVHVGAASGPGPAWIDDTLRMMAAELRQLRPGGEAVTTRLADVLVTQAIRSWLEQDPAAHRGWLGALQDDRIGRALAAVHREPGRHWTVDALAREATMSRSAFAARFTALVGEPVMTYVTRWRMQVARARLHDGDTTTARLAAELGYRSEAAFTRAFARVTGTTPGAARRRARAAADAPGPVAVAAPASRPADLAGAST